MGRGASCAGRGFFAGGWRSPRFSALLAVALLGLASSAPAVTYTVTSTADDGAGSLRVGMQDATVDVIVFGSGLSAATINLVSQLPVVDRDLSIDAAAAPGLVIDGMATNRVFFVRSGTVEIRNLSIQNGLGRGGDGAGNGGRRRPPEHPVVLAGGRHPDHRRRAAPDCDGCNRRGRRADGRQHCRHGDERADEKEPADDSTFQFADGFFGYEMRTRHTGIVFQIRGPPIGFPQLLSKNLFISKKADVGMVDADHPKIVECRLQVFESIEYAGGFGCVDHSFGLRIIVCGGHGELQRACLGA